MEAVAHGRSCALINSTITTKHQYNFSGVGFFPIEDTNFQHIFGIPTKYYVIISSSARVHEAERPLPIHYFPPRFTPFQNVYQQHHNTFAGIYCYFTFIN